MRKQTCFGILSFSVIIFGICLSCSKSNIKSSHSNNDFVPIEEFKEEPIDISEPDTTEIIGLMEFYQTLDTIEANKRFDTYKSQVENRENYSQEDIDWYFINISHIDSVAESAIKLTREGKYDDLARLLDSELENFYSHPKTNSEAVYDLHMVMVPLYNKIIPTKKLVYEKMIEMWEFNKAIVEMVMLRSGEPQELYPYVLHDLSLLYDAVGDSEKKSEIDSILNASIPEDN